MPRPGCGSPPSFPAPKTCSWSLTATSNPRARSRPPTPIPSPQVGRGRPTCLPTPAPTWRRPTMGWSPVPWSTAARSVCQVQAHAHSAAGHGLRSQRLSLEPGRLGQPRHDGHRPERRHRRAPDYPEPIPTPTPTRATLFIGASTPPTPARTLPCGYSTTVPSAPSPPPSITRLAAQWDNLAITQASDFIAPPAAARAPTFTRWSAFTSPPDGTNIVFTDAPAGLTISASASDSDGTVTNVEFYAGATRLGEIDASPYTFLWSGFASGSYELTAVATDNLGATTVSAPVSLSVTSPPTPVLPALQDRPVGHEPPALVADQLRRPCRLKSPRTCSHRTGRLSPPPVFSAATSIT